MYIDESSYKAKIGVVSIDTINNKVIRIRYTYPKGKRNAFYVGIINEENWREAIKTAHIIDRDISIGDYDPTLVRYKPNKAQTLEVVDKQPNLLDIWEVYRDISKDRVAATTIKKHWRTYEKHYLDQTPKNLLELNKARAILTAMKEWIYSIAFTIFFLTLRLLI